MPAYSTYKDMKSLKLTSSHGQVTVTIEIVCISACLFK